MLKEYSRYVLPTAYASIHDKEEQDARSSIHHLGEAGGNPSLLHSSIVLCHRLLSVHTRVLVLLLFHDLNSQSLTFLDGGFV